MTGRRDGTRTSEDPPSPRLRADARRNVEKLRDAAREIFLREGLETPLEDIARRAGVSIGTLYNRFGSRAELIDQAVADVAAQRLVALAGLVDQAHGPWARFAAFVWGTCEMQAADRAFNDVVARRYADAPRLRAICDDNLVVGDDLMRTAQASGVLRHDVTRDDLYRLFRSIAALIRDGEPDDGWRRHLEYFLDGLRTGGPTAR
ncbi:TetR/AcrR family transcriptional regulator [Streptomyces sp. T028]|uniref:TetR/AcrR family transcriptional regulator n=1 Tax=Streptomyces sp. T028 TaxID=3394379 RepID=UPI003A84A177